MLPNNPIQQYQEQAINTMSKGELLIKLYDEALKNLNYGSILLKQENYQAAEKCTDKCKNIFNYLSSVLDRKYDISANLYKLYYFINQEIIRASIKHDASIIDGVVPLVEDLRNTWVEAEKLSHMNKQ